MSPKYLNLDNLQIRQMLKLNEIEKVFKDLNIPINDNNMGIYNSLNLYPKYIDRPPLKLNRKELVTTIIAIQK